MNSSAVPSSHYFVVVNPARLFEWFHSTIHWRTHKDWNSLVDQWQVSAKSVVGERRGTWDEDVITRKGQVRRQGKSVKMRTDMGGQLDELLNGFSGRPLSILSSLYCILFIAL